MEDPKDLQSEQSAQLSEEQLDEVAGGSKIQETRLELLDNQTKDVKDIQQTRLEHLDNQTK